MRVFFLHDDGLIHLHLHKQGFSKIRCNNSNDKNKNKNKQNNICILRDRECGHRVISKWESRGGLVNHYLHA